MKEIKDFFKLTGMLKVEPTLKRDIYFFKAEWGNLSLSLA